MLSSVIASFVCEPYHTTVARSLAHPFSRKSLGVGAEIFFNGQPYSLTPRYPNPTVRSLDERLQMTCVPYHVYSILSKIRPRMYTTSFWLCSGSFPNLSLVRPSMIITGDFVVNGMTSIARSIRYILALPCFDFLAVKCFAAFLPP